MRVAEPDQAVGMTSKVCLTCGIRALGDRDHLPPNGSKATQNVGEAANQYDDLGREVDDAEPVGVKAPARLASRLAVVTVVVLVG